MHSFSASVGQRGQLAVVAPVGVGGQQVSVRIDGGDVAEIVIGEGIYRTGGKQSKAGVRYERSDNIDGC